MEEIILQGERNYYRGDGGTMALVMINFNFFNLIKY